MVTSLVTEQLEESATVAITLYNPWQWTITEILVNGVTMDVTSQLPDPAEPTLCRIVATAHTPTRFYSSYDIDAISFSAGSYASTVRFYDHAHTLALEFYKPIRTVEEWADIDSDMTANYRLKADIDFSYATNFQVCIDGGGIARSLSVAFTGKLDGGIYDEAYRLIGRHTVSNMNPANRGYVFFQTKSGTQLSNLVFDHLDLYSNSQLQNATYVGMIYQAYGGTIRGVTVQNSGFRARAFTAPIAAYSSSATFLECSSINNLVEWSGAAGSNVSLGGLVAFDSNYTRIERCFVRGLTMRTGRAPSINGAGGLVGYLSGSGTVLNCYTAGTIEADAVNVGGLIGLANGGSSVTNCMSAVGVYTSSDVAGGLIGKSQGTVANCLAIGDVYGRNSNTISVGRTAGFAATDITQTYAYEGQLYLAGTGVDTSLPLENLRPYAELCTADAYTAASNRIFDDYASYCFDGGSDGSGYAVENGYLPLLVDENGDTLPLQNPIPLISDTTLEINASQLDQTAGKYLVQFTVTAPKTATLESYTLDGMTADGTEVRQSSTVGNKTMTVIRQYFAPTQYYDTYRLTANMKNSAGASYIVTARVNFGTPLYREISNALQWQQVMAAYGQNYENFRITGNIDFSTLSNPASAVKDLRLNRLEADLLNGQVQYFIGASTPLTLTQTVSNTSFITDLTGMVSGLEFKNLSLDYATKNLTGNKCGVIGTLTGTGGHLKFTNIGISAKAIQFIGCIGYVTGVLEHIELTDVSVAATSNYTGGLAGYVNTGSTVNDFTMRGTTAPDIENETAAYHASYFVSGAAYTGGLFGYIAGCNTKNVTATNIEVLGAGAYVSGLVGHGATTSNLMDPDTYGSLVNVTADHIRAERRTAMNYLGGLIGYGQARSNVTLSNFFVIDLAGSRTGGVAGGAFINNYSDMDVCDCTVANGTVIGSYAVGGFAGVASSMKNGVVQDVTVEARDNSPESDEDTGGQCAGAFGGVDVVANRALQTTGIYDCTVIAKQYAGGVMGRGGRALTGVTVTGTTVTAQRYAGGVMGDNGPTVGTTPGYMANSVIQADVTATDAYAGGFCGAMQMYPSAADNLNATQGTNLNVQNVFVGTITAGDYAAGGVAYVDKNVNLNASSPNFAGWVIAANINTTAGSHAAYLCLDKDGADNNAQMLYMRLHGSTTVNGVKATFPAYADNLTAETYKQTLLVTESDLSQKTFYTNTYAKGGLNNGSYWKYEALSALNWVHTLSGSSLSTLQADTEGNVTLFAPSLADGVYTVSADPTGYIRNGLSIWYDGYRSAHTTQSGEDGWRDLSGNGNDALTLNGPNDASITWQNDGWSVPVVGSYGNGSGMQLPDCMADILSRNNQAFTIEMTVRIDNLSTPFMYLLYGKNAGLDRVFYYGSNAYIYVSMNGTYRVTRVNSGGLDVFATITIKCDGTNVYLYQNGVQLGSGTYNGVMNADAGQEYYLGRQAISGRNYSLAGQYYAFRVYDRALTADEITENAEIDAMRFTQGHLEPSGVTARTSDVTFSDGVGVFPLNWPSGIYQPYWKATTLDSENTEQIHAEGTGCLNIGASNRVVFSDLHDDDGEPLLAGDGVTPLTHDTLIASMPTQTFTATAGLESGTAAAYEWYRADYMRAAFDQCVSGASSDAVLVGTEASHRFGARGFYWCVITDGGGEKVTSEVLAVNSDGYFPQTKRDGVTTRGSEGFLYQNHTYTTDANGIRQWRDVYDAQIDGGIIVPNDDTAAFTRRSFRMLFANGIASLPKLTVYASGVSSVNLEFDDSVPLDDPSYLPSAAFCVLDANGNELLTQQIDTRVYTLSYDFVRELTVRVFTGGASMDCRIKPDALRRTVSTSGAQYFFLNTRGVSGSRETVGDFVHLYGGFGLLSNGNIVSLNGNGVMGVVGQTRLLGVKPLYTASYNGKTLRTFHGFTDVSGTVNPLRMYVKNGSLFAVSASFADDAYGLIADTYLGTRYLTVLSDGALYDLENAISMPDNFRNASIRETSSSIDSSTHTVLIRYESGAIASFGYLSGVKKDLVSDLGDQSLITFAKSYFSAKVKALRKELADGYLTLIETQKAITVMGLTEDMLVTASEGASDGANLGGDSLADGESESKDGAPIGGGSLVNGGNDGNGEAPLDGTGSFGGSSAESEDHGGSNGSASVSGEGALGETASDGIGADTLGGAEDNGTIRMIAVYDPTTGQYTLMLESDLLDGTNTSVKERLERAGLTYPNAGINTAAPTKRIEASVWPILLVAALIVCVLVGLMLWLRRDGHANANKQKQRR